MAREERDYSHRSLIDKLGIKPGQRVCIRGNFSEPFERILSDAAGGSVSRSARAAYDAIFLYVEKPKDLDAIETLAAHLQPSGALWIVHPKGKGASPADGEVRAAGLSAGLVDNKISAFSDSHTATRYVIPKAKR